MEEAIKKQRKKLLWDLLLYMAAALWLWASAAYHTPKEYLWIAELFFAATMTGIYWSTVLHSKTLLETRELMYERDKADIVVHGRSEDEQFQFANLGSEHSDV